MHGPERARKLRGTGKTTVQGDLQLGSTRGAQQVCGTLYAQAPDIVAHRAVMEVTETSGQVHGMATGQFGQAFQRDVRGRVLVQACAHPT